MRGGINLYGYAGNNPTNQIDPSGLQQVSFSNNQGNYPPAPPTYAPLYPDNYDWWGAFWDAFARGFVTTYLDGGMCVTLKAQEALNDPGVQLAAVGIGPLSELGAVEGLAPVESVSPSGIRFSQSSVNGMEGIATNMRANGWQGPPIDLVRMPDGLLTAADNTRVLAAHEAGIEVQAVIHESGSALPLGFSSRFTTRSGGIPQTWGDAIFNRINNQNGLFRSSYPYGSPFTGVH